MYNLIIFNDKAIICNATFDCIDDFNFVTDMYKLKFCHWDYDLDMEEGGIYRVLRFKRK